MKKSINQVEFVNKDFKIQPNEKVVFFIQSSHNSYLRVGTYLGLSNIQIPIVEYWKTTYKSEYDSKTKKFSRKNIEVLRKSYIQRQRVYPFSRFMEIIQNIDGITTSY